MKEFSKGAEWRKWDLHVHTPASYDYKDKSLSSDDIMRAVIAQNVSVIAITDHHVMDIDMITELQNIGSFSNITVLPGIEFLSDARGKEPIHFIGVFPETCNLSYIWGQIQNKTAIRKIIGEGKKENEVYCDLEDTVNLIHSLGGVVSIHSGRKHSSVETITNSLPHTMAQKVDIAKNVDIYELGKPEDQVDYRNIVFPAIKKTLPMIICSDNHDCKNYELKENCWIKADPNFEGLLQIINEPEERVFIGEKPDLFNRVAVNRTKYIKELRVSHVAGYSGSHGRWFDNISIPFNKELVAIIGNKGSGKSAVADIVALCANYNGGDFSFLTGKKFRIRNGQVAKNFEAILVWDSDEREPFNLNGSSDPTAVIEAKYIPQGQFEKLTNEIEDAKKFQKEIESVVFSHIADVEKYGSSNFTELVESKEKTVDAELKVLFERIDALNFEIIKLESKTTETYKQTLDSELAKKNEELLALIEPASVSDPNEDPIKKKANEAALAEIDGLKSQIDSLEKAVDSINKTQFQLLQDLKLLKEVRHEILAKSNEYDIFKDRIHDSVSKYELNVDDLFSVNFNLTPLEDIVSIKQGNLDQVQTLLGKKNEADNAKSLPDQILSLKSQLKEKQSRLDSDQQTYQSYLNAKLVWENEKKKIIGEPSSAKTISWYVNELKYIEEELSAELSDKYEDRKSIVRDIYKKRYEIVEVYKSAKQSLTEVIDDNADILGDYKIGIDAAMVADSKFKSDFLHFINQAKAGTFRSREGADKEFEELIADVNFDAEEEVLRLLEKLLCALNEDRREGQKLQKRAVVDQVNDLYGLYDYLFKLKFLNYNYQLKQGDKKLEQLSPGERGALLLVFYLLLDKNDIPLIIDQPEDNLDNNSVAKILVPFIRKAKKRRQIILVTHNPNLAVVSDAEQIIHVSLNKDNNYSFSVLSGSIENPKINEKIVNVLEGAMPAFNVRKSKYYG
ncbi:TrlF family AAA-like ATPase [Maridesulfovibrio sp.]|uniref:TrlF family AAA-like ATPase n=1 Tax=unclassified Maridesulfovibrio TaxID=2794999 RepID=UPI003AFF7289